MHYKRIYSFYFYTNSFNCLIPANKRNCFSDYSTKVSINKFFI